MGTRGVSLIVAALAAVLIAAGCGGGSSGGGGDVSKAEFIKKADAVCKRNTQRMQLAIFRVLKTKHGIKKPKESEYVRLVGKVIVPNVRKEVEELRALDLPSEEGDTAKAMIDALEEGLEVAENDPKAVAASSDAVFGIASRLAKEFGLQVCGNR